MAEQNSERFLICTTPSVRNMIEKTIKVMSVVVEVSMFLKQ
jgi:hypothetical protein